MQGAVANIEGTAARLDTLLAAIDPENLNGVLVDARDTMKEIELAAASIANLSASDSATTVRLNRTLAAFEEASRAVQQLAAYLKRNPNALISGKKR